MYIKLAGVILLLLFFLISWLIRVMRKTDKDPNQEYVFSKGKVAVVVGAVGSLLILGAIVDSSLKSPDNANAVSNAIVGGSVFMLVPLFMLIHGLAYHFAVDREKIWWRFGKLYYREIRFRDVTRLHKGIFSHKLYVGKEKVNLNLYAASGTLIHLRLLEELQHRRFDLPKFPTDDPGWETGAQHWRKWLAGRLYQEHQMFYDSNPEALAYLNSLTETPSHYDN